MKSRFINKLSVAIVLAFVLMTFINTGFAGRTAAGASKPAVQAGGEVKLPDTPAAKTFAAFLKALNSGDVEIMKKFHKEYAGNIENAQKDWEFYQESGGIKLVSISKSSDYTLELVIETKSDSAKLSFAIVVSKNAPHAIESIQIHPA
jgi:hypothetical protein